MLLQNVLVQNTVASAARQWINSVPQTAETTFAFSSALIFLLYVSHTHLELLVVEPGLQGLEDGVLRKRALQPDQILDIGQPAVAYLLNEGLLAASLTLRGRGSRLGGHRSENVGECEKETRKHVCLALVVTSWLKIEHLLWYFVKSTYRSS